MDTPVRFALLQLHRLFPELLIDEPAHQRLQRFPGLPQNEIFLLFRPVQFEARRQRGYPDLADGCIRRDHEPCAILKADMQRPGLVLDLDLGIVFGGNQ